MKTRSELLRLCKAKAVEALARQDRYSERNYFALSMIAKKGHIHGIILKPYKKALKRDMQFSIIDIVGGTKNKWYYSAWYIARTGIVTG